MRRGTLVAVFAWLGACRSFGSAGGALVTEPDGGDAAPADASVDDSAAADTGLADGGPTIGCGNLRCPASGGCCYDAVHGGTRCVPTAAECDGSYFLCSGHADCTVSKQLAGTVCCSLGHFDDASAFQIDRAECLLPGSCNTRSTEDILCDPSELGGACEGTPEVQTCSRAWETFLAPPFKNVTRCYP